MEANSSCPRCGAAFRCGMVPSPGAGMAGEGPACWCLKRPHVMPVPAGPAAAPIDPNARCFCPDCLQKITDERQHPPLPAGD